MELYIKEGKGTLSSSGCLDLVLTHWVNWAGYPKQIISDCGSNNSGIFIKDMNAAGVFCSSIGLEAANQLAKVERHGDMWKGMIEVVVVETDHRRTDDEDNCCRDRCRDSYAEPLRRILSIAIGSRETTKAWRSARRR